MNNFLNLIIMDKMNKKYVLIASLLSVLLVAGAFSGGMMYQKSRGVKSFDGTRRTAINGSFRQNSDGQGSRMNRMPGGGSGDRNGSSGAFLGGEIIAKDDKSITIKTPDGSSKIVYYSASTAIGKMTDGGADDLAVGKNVMINGKTGTEGIVDAQNIQIRPDSVTQ
jgi:hypothetical protein